MSKLAERARVSRPTLYTHFPTLEHVLAAWFDREVAEFHGSLEGRLAETDDPLKRLTVYLTAQCGSSYLRWGRVRHAGEADAVM